MENMTLSCKIFERSPSTKWMISFGHFERGNFKIIPLYLESFKTTYWGDNEGHQSSSIKTARISYTFVFTMSNI